MADDSLFTIGGQEFKVTSPWTVTADQYAWLWADAYMAAHGCSDRAKGTHPS